MARNVFESEFRTSKMGDDSIHLHARVVILKLQSGLRLDICVTSSCNERACNKRLYGTIASHDEVWQFYRGI